MGYASFRKNPEQPVRQRDITENGMSQGKAIAKVYGYMGIGLLVTGIVAFLTALLFSSQINQLLDANGFLDVSKVDIAKGWVLAIFITWGVALVAILILSFVIPFRAAVSGKSLWVPYILYAIFMGVIMSAILLAGIPFWMIGEAFGITCLAFVAMFLIGWFSKKDLSILGYIGMALLFGVLIAAIVGGITFWVRGGTATQRFWFDIAIQGAMILVIMIITVFDTWRIKQIIANAGESKNIYLYGAYVMYTDFITLLLRILILLARLYGNNR